MFRTCKAPLRKWVGTTVSVLLLLAASSCASASPFMGKTAAELWAEAQQDFAEGDYQKAIDGLDWLISSFPEFALAADAQYLLARTYFEDEQYILASDEYQRFYQRFPAHTLTPEAALGVCRAEAALSPKPERDQFNTGRAAQVCGEVARTYQAFPVAAEAGRIAIEMRAKLAQKEYKTGDYYFRRRAYDSAIMSWERVVEDWGDTAWAPTALLAISRAYERIRYAEEATEARQRLLNLYPDSPEAEQVRPAAAPAPAASAPPE